jgi:hypothetical protein
MKTDVPRTKRSINTERTQSHFNRGSYASCARSVGMTVNGESFQHVEINEEVGEAGVDEERAYDGGLWMRLQRPWRTDAHDYKKGHGAAGAGFSCGGCKNGAG